MRGLIRNQRTFYYATYSGKNPVSYTDEYGNVLQSGEYATTYSAPVKTRGNISTAAGQTVNEIFGTADGYDKVILLDDPDTPIDEYSILWLDTSPNGGAGSSTAANDYIVKRVARSLNYCAIAAQKVNVDANN